MSRTTLPVLATFASLFLSHGAFASDAFDEAVDREALGRLETRPHRAVCAEGDGPRCFAKVVTDDSGETYLTTKPEGLSPAELQSAYKLPTTGGHGKLIAIVDVGDYPNAESDLAVYRAQFGLPPCTSANGCFKKVDEHGGTNYPTSTTCKGGSVENALDIQMVSAACPDCRIVLVEPASYSAADLGASIDTVIAEGAVAISNSYTVGGYRTTDIPVFTHPGVLITASAGDHGYNVAYPASFSSVVAIGGTSLVKSSSSRGWAEAAWKGSGSGCSSDVAKPAWQTSVTDCANRMVTDVSAIADPSTGVSFYCTNPGDTSAPSWGIVGGTSVSSPLIAAIFTLLGVTPEASYIWSHPSKFFDVTSGSNGTCSESLWCNGEVGYDGPTGWGTPNGALLIGSEADAGGGGDDAGSTHDAGSSSDGGTPVTSQDAGDDSGSRVADASTSSDAGDKDASSPILGGQDAGRGSVDAASPDDGGSASTWDAGGGSSGSGGEKGSGCDVSSQGSGANGWFASVLVLWAAVGARRRSPS